MKKFHIPQSHTGGRVACRYGSRPSRSKTVRPVSEDFFLTRGKAERCKDCEAILARRQGTLALNESVRAGIKDALQHLLGSKADPSP